MGLFRRTTDDPNTFDFGSDMNTPTGPQQSLPAPSLDGVLPPGTSPQPSMQNNGVASQSNTPVVDDVLQQVDASLLQSSQPFDDPSSNDDVGDYIMADPPVSAPAEPTYHDDFNAPASQPIMEIPSVSEPVAVSQPEPVHIEPDYSPVESDYPADPTYDSPADPVSSDNPQDLADIKLQALQQLSSIAGHLDQSPEEKFHTTMMMLQATDDQSLIKVAYDAAQAITDEKTRAQALLDVVNEINYFAQKK